MKQRKKAFVATTLLATMLFQGNGKEVRGQQLERNVLGSGGTAMRGEGIQVSTTFGQFTAGNIGTTNMTIGQGFWFELDQSETSSVERSQEPQKILRISLYPNPVNVTSRISLFVPETGRIRVNLYNSLGQGVVELFDGMMMAGNREIELLAEDLEAGRYTLVLEQGETRVTEPVIVVH